MYCPECGTKNDENAVFCENCGTRLKETESESYDVYEMDAPAEPDTETDSLDLTEDLSTDTRTDAAPEEDLDSEAEEAGEETKQEKGKKEKEKRPLSKKGRRAQIISVLAAVAAVIILIACCNFLLGSSHIAEKYASAALKGNWSVAYDNMYVQKKGEFTTKEAFVTAATVAEDSSIGEKYTILSVNKQSGSLFHTTYDVKYATADAVTGSMTLDLKRDGLFWKVEPTEGHKEGSYSISVPEGATVTVDKIIVSDQYKVSTDDGSDTYTISPIFGDIHYVEVTGDNVDNIVQLVKAPEGETAAVTAKYNEETIKEVVTKAATDLRSILNAAVQDMKVTAVDAISESYEETKEELLNKYESLKDNDFGYGGNSPVSGYSLSNLAAYAYPTVENGKSAMRVEINGDYKLTGGSNGTREGTCTHTLSYVHDEGEWVLYDMKIDVN